MQHCVVMGLSNLVKVEISEEIIEKGENADDQHFLLLPTMFSTLLKKKKLSF